MSDRGGPLIDHQLQAVKGVGLLPAEVIRGFHIEDEAVQVEDDNLYMVGHAHPSGVPRRSRAPAMRGYASQEQTPLALSHRPVCVNLL
jgi:hypothetical protein